MFRMLSGINKSYLTGLSFFCNLFHKYKVSVRVNIRISLFVPRCIILRKIKWNQYRYIIIIFLLKQILYCASIFHQILQLWKPEKDEKYYFFLLKKRRFVYQYNLKNIFNSPPQLKNENLVTFVRFKRMEDFLKRSIIITIFEEKYVTRERSCLSTKRLSDL